MAITAAPHARRRPRSAVAPRGSTRHARAEPTGARSCTRHGPRQRRARRGVGRALQRLLPARVRGRPARRGGRGAGARRGPAGRRPDGGDVLDVPCGFGRHALPLAAAGYRVTGVDRSPTLLDEARRRAGGGAWPKFAQRRLPRPAVPRRELRRRAEPLLVARLPGRRGGHARAGGDRPHAAPRRPARDRDHAPRPARPRSSPSRTGGSSARAGCCSSSAPSTPSRASPRSRRRSSGTTGRATRARSPSASTPRPSCSRC